MGAGVAAGGRGPARIRWRSVCGLRPVRPPRYRAARSVGDLGGHQARVVRRQTRQARLMAAMALAADVGVLGGPASSCRHHVDAVDRTGATHRSQPVHQSASTVCMRLLAPTMASTGQAWMQSVQPMQWASSMRATSSGPGWPRVRSSGRMGCSSSAASAAMPSSPPGGQRLMGLRRRRWRRRRAGSRHGRTWCIASAAIARRCGRRAGTGHGDSVETKGAARAPWTYGTAGRRRG